MARTPGPRGWPVVGSLVELARDPIKFYASLPRQWGDVCVFSVGRVKTFIVAHPDGIHQVLVEYRDAMHKDEVTAGLSRILGQGLLTSEDPLWSRQRKLAAPSFQPRQLGHYGQIMIDAALERVNAIGPGERDVHADMVDVTRQIVLRALFGTADAEGERVAEIVHDFSEVFERELRSVQRLLPRTWPTPATWKMRRLRQQLEPVIDRIIAAHPPDGDDLLSRFLAARDDDGAPMSPEQLRDEAITVFLAGHETTALALTYAIWLLAADRDLQGRLRAEVEEVTGGGPLLAEHRKDLRWVEAVMQEAMRLHPPAWLIGRTPTRDVVIQGHLVPRGCQILVPIYALHRDPRFWPDPEVFRPERWLNGETESLPRFVYFPFGGGPRVCVGNHFAMLEAVLVLAAWVRTRAVRRPPGATLELMPAVTLRPRRGVRVTVDGPTG